MSSRENSKSGAELVTTASPERLSPETVKLWDSEGVPETDSKDTKFSVTVNDGEGGGGCAEEILYDNTKHRSTRPRPLIFGELINDCMVVVAY